MIITKKITEIRAELKKHKSKKIAFVPTMGALHDGHLALVKQAKESADIVVVSIFVNKKQFNDPKDYENYPRQDTEDLEKLEKIGADFVFLPNEKEMFGEDISFKITISPSNVTLSFPPVTLSFPPVTPSHDGVQASSQQNGYRHKDGMTREDGIKKSNLIDCLCGRSRPGHFDGVALIVSKLFNIIKPDIAIFGQKDFQQLAIIKKLVKDLNFDIEIFASKTHREKSGLAMSSRNQRLSEDAKIKAAEIYKILVEIKNEIEKSPKKITEILKEKQQNLLKIGFEKIDYLEIRTEDNLELVEEFNSSKKSRIFFAGYLEGVRLIDNL